MPELEFLTPDWAAPVNVRSLVTTRQGGVSMAPWDSLNLALHVGDNPASVKENRRRLRKHLGLPAEPLWLQQVHGTAVVDVAQASQACDADAAVAFAPHQVCTVMTADCLPVLFCDRQGSRVAAAHAGWRGLLNGVLEATVQQMNTSADNLLAWLGPAIGPQAFEVGGEVRDAFLSHASESADAFHASDKTGRYFADLYVLARQRLHALGLTTVSGGGYCTFSEAERFYSYRREGQCGRMASLIWLTDAPAHKT